MERINFLRNFDIVSFTEGGGAASRVAAQLSNISYVSFGGEEKNLMHLS